MSPSLWAEAAALYLLGKYTGDDHKKETGILAIEAATNSLIVGEVLKAVTQRARPTDGNFKGEFFNSTSISNSSFPSVHALLPGPRPAFWPMNIPAR